MLKSLLEGFGAIVDDVSKVVLAPAVVAVDVTRAVTKPVAEVAEEVSKGVGDVIDGGGNE